MFEAFTVDLESLNNGIQTQIYRITYYNPHSTDPISLLFSSGYFTINDYDSMIRIYTLRYFNIEIKFFSQLLDTSYM